MKILVLVLSADFPPYDKMIHTALNTWEKVEVENTQTLFYCGAGHKANTDKIVYLPVTEGLYNIGHKTVKALEHALDNYEFDYIARVHSSIYVDKARLYEYCQSLRKDNLFAGVIADSQNGFKYQWGGVGFILSQDVVKRIVYNKSLWNHKYMEDESLGLICSDLGIPFTPMKSAGIDKLAEGYQCISYEGESITFTDFADVKRLGHHYYRVKHDPDRSVDGYVMNQLFTALNQAT